MAGVFINYRRDDARSEAGRLFDWLSQYFGKDQVFMDVSGSIEPGLEFDRVIENAVSSCEVLIVVIGKEWLTAVDENKQRRLENPHDFVRLEIAAALKRNIRVIPVLVEGAAMPEESDLPEDLKRLCKRQASELSDNRWEFDTKQLVNVLQRAGMGVGPGPTVVSHDHSKPPPQVTKKTSWKAVASLVSGVLLMISFAEVTVDQETTMGALLFALVALGLSIAAFYDGKHNPEVSGTKGEGTVHQRYGVSRYPEPRLSRNADNTRSVRAAGCRPPTFINKSVSAGARRGYAVRSAPALVYRH